MYLSSGSSTRSTHPSHRRGRSCRRATCPRRARPSGRAPARAPRARCIEELATPAVGSEPEHLAVVAAAGVDRSVGGGHEPPQKWRGAVARGRDSRPEQQAAVHVDREVLDLAAEKVGLRGHLPEPRAGGVCSARGERDETDGRERPQRAARHHRRRRGAKVTAPRRGPARGCRGPPPLRIGEQGWIERHLTEAPRRPGTARPRASVGDVISCSPRRA